MEIIKVNFFGEQSLIKKTLDFNQLKLEITNKFSLSSKETSEIIIYYLNENKEKIDIKSKNDYDNFLSSKYSELFADINKNEANYVKNKLEELIENQKKYKKMKSIIFNSHFRALDDISEQIRILEIKKYNLMKENDKKMKEVDLLINNNEKEIQIIKQKLGIFKSEKNKIYHNFIYNLAPKKIEDKHKNEMTSVFNKVNEVLYGTVEKVKNEMLENKNKQEIKKIKQITKEAVQEINNLTKIVISQSNELILKISQENINSNSKENLKSTNSQIDKEKINNTIHFMVECKGCKRRNQIKGIRYKCKVCKNFDLCEKCYKQRNVEHNHEFVEIFLSEFPQYKKPENIKYLRGIIHKNKRCNVCGMLPINGYRYKCAICNDFNFCENCEEKEGTRHNHPLIKFRYSLMEKEFNDSYLKLNNY